jgi:hypothetical protein
VTALRPAGPTAAVSPRTLGAASAEDALGAAAPAVPLRPAPPPEEIGAVSAQTRAPLPGIVVAEGGGPAPHPLGGGAEWPRPQEPRPQRPVPRR